MDSKINVQTPDKQNQLVTNCEIFSICHALCTLITTSAGSYDTICSLTLILMEAEPTLINGVVMWQVDSYL